MNTIPLSLLVNRAAIARVACIEPRRILEFGQEFDGLVVARIKPTKADPRGALVYSMEQMIAEFHRFRRENSRSLVVMGAPVRTMLGLRHRVEGAGADIYFVEERAGRLNCNCEDYHQHETLCKHGWAVLNSLGCNSLLELQAMRQKEAKAARISSEWPGAVAPLASRSKPKTYKGVAIE
jgi:hypothetical protein